MNTVHTNGTHAHHERFVSCMINKNAGLAQAACKMLNCPQSPAEVIDRGECGRALGLHANKHRLHAHFYPGICCSYEVLHNM